MKRVHGLFLALMLAVPSYGGQLVTIEDSLKTLVTREEMTAVSNTTRALTASTDVAVNLTTVAGTSKTCTLIIGSDGSCVDLLFTFTRSASAPSSYLYVSGSAMPFAVPHLKAGTVAHFKTVTSDCLSSLIVLTE